MESAETPRTHAAASFPATAGEHWIEALRDGRHVLIRPLEDKDREREYAFIKRLSPESRHMRFLAQINEPSDSLLNTLMDMPAKFMMANAPSKAMGTTMVGIKV